MSDTSLVALPRDAIHNRLRWLALALVCAASFMEILDAQIVTVAIPSIERSQWLGWRSIFFLNVPIGAAIFALSPVVLARSTERLGSRMNLSGALTVGGAFLLLVYAINQAAGASWLDPTILWPLCGFVVLGTLFVVSQKRSAQPLVPIRIFRSRTLVGGDLVMFAAAFCVFGEGIVLTQYAQQVIGYGPLEFGLMSAVVPAMAMIGSIASQRAVSKTGLRPVAAISLMLMAVGCGLLTQLSPHGDFVRNMLPGTLLLGLGLGAGTVAASIASITGIGENDAGVASGINNMTFAIGGALGVAGLTSVSLAWNDHVLGRPGMSAALARTEGFRWAFAVAMAIAVLGVIAALTLIGGKSSPESSPEG